MTLASSLAARAAALMVLAISPNVASAAVIDFNTLPNGNPPVTTYTENGFTFSVIDGSFNGTSGNGAPPPSVYTPDDSGTASVTDGGLFTFKSVALGNGALSGSANFTLTGLLNGAALYSFNESVGAIQFNTYTNAFSSVSIDDLHIAVSGDGNIDNINVSPAASAVSAAPEPAAWALIFAGVAILGAMLRRSRRQDGVALAA